MSQMTIYLDNALEVKAKEVSRLIRKKLNDEWSPKIRALNGNWKNFPSIENIRTHKAPDIKRV